ncbi:hypothetical protein ACHAW5_005669 [Stephanodiscus triporus]|uniref:Uncharacterized protein n=1 Tax=Stephanodiscus triporus TaxID=2934178 RepID=A0ABD3QI24_9STRA
MQKSMFQMKKIIAGLLAFVFILALTNLGTSFASAILAKDTMTNNGQLVDKNTNEAVATASAVNDYAVGKDEGDNMRALQVACTGIVEDTTNGGVCDTSATTTSGTTTMPADKAQAMLKDCLTNKFVNLKTTSGVTVTTAMICGPSVCTSGSTFTCPGNSGCAGNTRPTYGALCIQGSPNKCIVQVAPTNPKLYTLHVQKSTGTTATEDLSQ